MWYQNYLGKPWQKYATGPNAFDCWGLVVHVLREHYGLHDVPRCDDVVSGDCLAYTKRAKEMQRCGKWKQVGGAVSGAVALMGGAKLVTHIGIVCDGMILHCRSGAGVCIESPSDLIRDCGYVKIEYWKHVDL